MCNVKCEVLIESVSQSVSQYSGVVIINTCNQTEESINHFSIGYCEQLKHNSEK